MIDKQIKRPWPEEVGKALVDIRQGDVVKAPPFFYAHGGGIRLWDMPADEDDGVEKDRAAGDDGRGEDRKAGAADGCHANEPAEENGIASQVEELHPDDAPPFGVITSQTCDLAEQGAKPSQVWFQVSPVYLVPDDPAEATRLLIKQYIVELTGPDFPDGRWVADLRIELPFEKSWLVAKGTFRGFKEEDEAEKFGVMIGRRRARPALANELVDNITSLIRQRKQVRKPPAVKKLTRDIWADDVYRVMLAIEGGTRLKPAAVQLHVLCPDEPTNRVREWFGDWEDHARGKAEVIGIDLLMTRFHDARKVDLHQYDRWVQLDFG